jgi:hypothetical protein
VIGNEIIHRHFEHGHNHEHSDEAANFRGAQIHAAVDRVVSPVLLLGLGASHFTPFTNADDIAAFTGAMMTLAGNGPQALSDLMRPLPARAEARHEH